MKKIESRLNLLWNINANDTQARNIIATEILSKRYDREDTGHRSLEMSQWLKEATRRRTFVEHLLQWWRQRRNI